MRKLAALCLCALGLTPVLAEHATITLKVYRVDADGMVKEEVGSRSDQEPPKGGIIPRPLLKAKANEPLVLQFVFINTYPHGVNKDVTVRYYVVREEQAKQKEVPDLKKGTVIEGTFALNFKPKCRVGARLAFTVPEPGVYLVRVDSLNTSKDHEHFSAIDLQVE